MTTEADRIGVAFPLHCFLPLVGLSLPLPPPLVVTTISLEPLPPVLTISSESAEPAEADASAAAIRIATTEEGRDNIAACADVKM